MSNNGVTLNLPEIRSTLKEYARFTKRDIPTMLNTKGFYISRGAVRDTHRVEEAQIRVEMDQLIREEGMPKGKYKNVKRFDSVGREQDVPLAALLVNARRGRRGLPGLNGSKMAYAVSHIVGNRLRSRAFIASGFLPAVKAFEPHAEHKGQAPPRDSEVAQRGRAKGYGIPANDDTYVAVATISNTADAKGDKRGALDIYGTKGLQTAVADEVRSMEKYMVDHMQATANKFNAR